MNHTMFEVIDMPERIVIAEAPFSVFDRRDDRHGQTYGQQLISKLESDASGSQGAFYTDNPEFLSSEAREWNAMGNGERYVALVARMDPTIRWYSPDL